VIVAPNAKHPSRFDVLINGQLVLPARFESPIAAMDHLHRRDLGDQELESRFIGLRVPADPKAWQTCDCLTLSRTRCKIASESHD
jgi:hypothetical protein